MKVFVAGATGAMGKQLVPRLLAKGHEVAGMTSKEANRGLVTELGATPVVADALDPDQVAEAAHDVVLTGDGGGRGPAPVRPLQGRSRVARTLMNWLDHLTRIPGLQMQPTELNGSPGTLLLDGEQRVVGAWVLEIGGGQVQGIRSIVNPDKLAHLGPTGDLGALLRTWAGSDRV